MVTVKFALYLALSACCLAACGPVEERHERSKHDKPRERLSSVSYVAFMDSLHKKIKPFWLPKTSSGKNGAVMFSLNRRGDLSDLKISRSSGDQDFDKDMLATINLAVPMPTLPVGAPHTVPVEFTFNHDVYLYLMKGAPAEIKQAIEKIDRSLAAAKAETQGGLYFERGKLWLQIDEKEKALADFSKAIASGKSDVEILTARAKANHALGYYQECLNDCAQILKLDSRNSDIYVLQSDAYLNSGKITEAFAAANQAIIIAPQQPDGYTARAYAYNLSGDYKKAIADCNLALDRDKQCTAAYAYRGDAEEELKMYERALSDYDKTIELSPLDAGALLRRAELQNQIGHFHKAIIDCTDAIRLDPDNGEAYFYRSYANSQLSLAAQAKNDQDKAESLGFIGQ